MGCSQGDTSKMSKAFDLIINKVMKDNEYFRNKAEEEKEEKENEKI